MNLCTSVFVYVGSIGLYKRIVNADGQGPEEFETFACVLGQTPFPVRLKALKGGNCIA